MELWKEIPNVDNYYLISNLGRIKSLSREVLIRGVHKGLLKEKIIKQVQDKNGYMRVPLKNGKERKTYKVHRLVMEAFFENKNKKPCVNHKNGIKNDNRLSNLEWCTHSENTNHAIDKGLMEPCFGEMNGNSKLTKNEVLIIKSLKGKKTQKQIGEMFNVNSKTIGSIHRNKTWKNIN